MNGIKGKRHKRNQRRETMDYRFSRGLRVISSIVLFFFLWTFELSGIAYAIKNDQQAITKQTAKTKPEKKIGKHIEDIDDILKSTADTETKINKVRAKKAEIEADEIEIKKAFDDTEKTLWEKGLPLEILERHRNFVKKYDDNYKELKDNLDAIDKAKTTPEADAAIEKAKAHLAKVKPPKKHKPLDPNNLPVKTPEEKQVIFEEWKPPAKRQIPPAFLKKSDIKNQKLIIIAANGSLKRLLNSDTRLMSENNIQLAQATTPVSPKNALPTAEDLQETSETKITLAIRAKAAELGNNPYKMWNWVLNNIDYVPTYGSIQGADMCLQTKQCNDIDTASLVIALFRVSGFPSRYVYEIKELPIDKFMNWIGGFTDPIAALDFAASAGIPVKAMTEGGQIKYVQFEHVLSISYIPYLPSRQGRPTDNIKIWIPLDASMPKYYKYTSGIDIKTAVPFDAQSFIDQIKISATINETEGYVTNVNSSLVQQSMQDYQTRVQNYISQNYPNATVGDVIGKREIIQKKYGGLIPGTEPLRTIAVLWKSPMLPDNLIHKVSFRVTSDNIYYDAQPLTITKLLPEIAGKKMTLSYAPATSTDEAVINSYLPKPHTDGTPIQPSEFPSSLPAYLINLKPELRIDGTVVATGGAIGMGEIEDFTITITPPRLSSQVVNNKVTAGEYNAVTLAVARISIDQLSALKTRIETTKASVEAGNFSGLTQDDIVGDPLSLALLSYFIELDAKDLVTAQIMGMTVIRLTSAGRYSMGLSVDWVFGMPLSVTADGYSMDIGLIRSLPFALDGNKTKKKQFMLASGMSSSALEHAVPEQLFSTPENPAQGISAVKALKIANEQGIPIYKITQSNVGIVLSQLLIDADAKADIANAVNAGKEVIASKANISLNGWTGSGYIVIDPTTGAGAYMISGGLSGGWFPVIIGSDCDKTYIERVLNNFELTNVTIPGLLAPTGLGILIGVPRAVAALMGTITLSKWASMLFSGAVMEGVAFTAMETGILVGATSLFSFLLISFAFEVGVLAGSFISAVVLPCEVKQ